MELGDRRCGISVACDGTAPVPAQATAVDDRSGAETPQSVV